MSRLIALAGPIGVGKSTLTRKLAQHFQCQAFYEHLEDNPYLAEYYAGHTAVCFEMQTYFLAQRTDQARSVERLLKAGTDVVLDRSIYEDFHIFATHQYQRGFLTERQYETYRRLFFAVTDLLYPPDLIIYLHAPTERLLEQIALRGRPYEKAIDSTYLGEINALYQQWLERLHQGPTHIPFVAIDVSTTQLLGDDFEPFCLDLEQRWGQR